LIAWWTIGAIGVARAAGDPERPNLEPKDPLPPPAESAPVAKRGILFGRVIEEGSGLPVVGTVAAGGATVVILDDGSFALDLPAGRHRVTIGGPEHVSIVMSELIPEGGAVEVTYRLSRHSWDEEVIVYGEETREEVTRRVFTAEELRLVPGSFGDPIRAIQSLPGVARPVTIEGDIVVRGAEALNTGTYVDEVPIPYLFHFFVGRSIINPALLDDVEFYAGGMPTRFGDVTQAVVNVRTLDTAPEPGWHGRVSADLLDFAVSAEGRINRHWTWQGGYRVSWIGGLLSAGVRTYALVKGFGDTRPPWATVAYWDWLSRASWENGEDRIVLTGFGARDAFVFHPPMYDQDGDGRPDPPPLPDDLPYDPYRLMDSGFHRVHLRWDHDEGARERSTWVAAGPDFEANLLQGIGVLSEGIEAGKLTGWTIVGKHRDRIPIDPDDTAMVGADALVVPVTIEDYTQLDENNDPASTSEVRTSVGLWGEWQRDLGDLWIAPGLRGGVHAFNDRIEVQPEPRLTVRRTLDDRWTATGFVGRFSQVPPADRYAVGIGNPDLEIMTAWQATSGVEGRWPSGVEVDLSVYGSRTENLVVKDIAVEMQPVLDFDPDSGGYSYVEHSMVVAEYRPVVGYAYGFEGMLRARPAAGWFGWVALTVGKAIRVDEGVVRPGDHDIPFQLTVVGATDLPRDFRASGRIRATSGYPYTPIHGVYLVDEDHWHGLEGEENAERLPWFRQLDLRVDRTWTKPRARWTAYADVYNVLNTKNYFLASYDPTFRELERQIWVPIIPAIGLEVEY
jgi:hypothetical protein